MLNPNIALSGSNGGSLFNAIQGGLDKAHQIKKDNLYNRVLEQRTNQQEKTFNREEAMQNAQTVDQMLAQLGSIPMNERAAVVQASAPLLKKLGVSDEELIGQSYDDESLAMRRKELALALNPQQAAPQLIDNKNISEQFDPETGQTYKTITVADPNSPQGFRTQRLGRVAPKAATQNKSEFEKQLMAAGYQPGTPEYQAKAGELLNAKINGRALVSVNTGNNAPYKIPNGFMMKDPNNPSLGVTPIPGSSQDSMTSENAGKTTMLQQGARDIEQARGLIFDERGKVDRKNLAAAAANIPFSDGRTLNSYIDNAVSAKLRAETGAAATEAELDNMRKRFQPKLTDSDNTIKKKLDRLEEFLNDSVDKIDSSSRFKEDRPETKSIFSKDTQDRLKQYE